MSNFASRKALYKKIEVARGSNVLAIVNGDRPGWETQFSRDFTDIAVDHLDLMQPRDKISLVLHTNGGDTLAAWRLVHLLRQFCKHLEVLVPLKALSAGTLVCLGANTVVMTKQASLGPIDPSITTPLNPPVQGAPPNVRAPVSVEAIQGFLDIATKTLGIKDDAAMASIFTHLSGQVHPLVLGQVFRARAQIQFLAKRLLRHQLTDPDKVDGIIAFLASESGSHDYTIDRTEARELGLQIETPTELLYKLMREVHRSFQTELRLNEPWDPHAMLGDQQTASYEVSRCLVESVRGGCNTFLSRGTLSRQSPQPPMMPFEQISDRREFEGWRKVV